MGGEREVRGRRRRREVKGKMEGGGEEFKGRSVNWKKYLNYLFFFSNVQISKERLYSSYFKVFIKVPRTTNNDFLGWK